MLGVQLEKDFTHNLSGFRKLIREVKGELGDKLLILLLDEMDSIATYDTRNNEALFKLMRSLSQEGICHYIFCGGKALYRRVHDPSSPFFNFGKEIILSCLDERSARESIERPMSDMGIELQEGEEIVDRILEVSSLHPNLVQSICERVIGNISERRITLDDVEEVISEADFHQYYKETVWGESNPLEKIVSLVMIDRGEFDLGDIQEELAKLGITDKRAIDEALVTQELYPIFTRVRRGYRYTLGYFPKIVKESEDVEILLQSLKDSYLSSRN